MHEMHAGKEDSVQKGGEMGLVRPKIVRCKLQVCGTRTIGHGNTNEAGAEALRVKTKIPEAKRESLIRRFEPKRKNVRETDYVRSESAIGNGDPSRLRFNAFMRLCPRSFWCLVVQLSGAPP